MLWLFSPLAIISSSIISTCITSFNSVPFHASGYPNFVWPIFRSGSNRLRSCDSVWTTHILWHNIIGNIRWRCWRDADDAIRWLWTLSIFTDLCKHIHELKIHWVGMTSLTFLPFELKWPSLMIDMTICTCCKFRQLLLEWTWKVKEGIPKTCFCLYAVNIRPFIRIWWRWMDSTNCDISLNNEHLINVACFCPLLLSRNFDQPWTT